MAHSQRTPSLLSRIVRWLIWKLYRFQGWKIDTGLPDIPKYVIAGAPHSSNWDFVFFTGATAEEGVAPSFMGKHTLFKGIMRNFMLDMGGVSIDRRKKSNATQQVAEAFAAADHLALVIAAEGTRSSNGEWKSGFYHIAQAANVPVVVAWVSWESRTLGFSDPIWPTGNYAEDLAKIAAYLRSKRPDYERYRVLEAQAARLLEEAKASG
ncbi:1-acyl-sn-glycerol-3-phosphate acyltransferase [Altererythrobacter sp.]|nr:1-acyl-sn-glycerol-3-phosphate acyltransferase [Altererythrobacter sp.]